MKVQLLFLCTEYHIREWYAIKQVPLTLCIASFDGLYVSDWNDAEVSKTGEIQLYTGVLHICRTATLVCGRLLDEADCSLMVRCVLCIYMA